MGAFRGIVISERKLPADEGETKSDARKQSDIGKAGRAACNDIAGFDKSRRLRL